jgi:hypothetical protein
VRAGHGIYVHAEIAADVERLWALTQQPELHQRWDLRFSSIEYLPRPNAEEPQRFLYATRIGLGMTIRGTGESAGERQSATGAATSALRFSSADRKSLIIEGSGYWRYMPTATGTRFLTWYDYRVRFGLLGSGVDRVLFRPLMAWATAWSFDRLRLWAEREQSPESSLRLSAVHAVSRAALSFVWIWHGLVPKLWFRNIDEQTMLMQAHLPLSVLPWLGAFEILFGLMTLFSWRSRSILLLHIVLMVAASTAVAIHSPQYLWAAFTPVTLNLSVAALALCGWLVFPLVPSAARCKWSAHRGEP